MEKQNGCCQCSCACSGDCGGCSRCRSQGLDRFYISTNADEKIVVNNSAPLASMRLTAHGADTVLASMPDEPAQRHLNDVLISVDSKENLIGQNGSEKTSISQLGLSVDAEDRVVIEQKQQ